jgi:hypothetical protein
MLKNKHKLFNSLNSVIYASKNKIIDSDESWILAKYDNQLNINN